MENASHLLVVFVTRSHGAPATKRRQKTGPSGGAKGSATCGAERDGSQCHADVSPQRGTDPGPKRETDGDRMVEVSVDVTFGLIAAIALDAVI
ncbi:MAG: hypothetical protein OES46_00510 [Gammaproteobacteria bacterium]|nr:hypothetical protein [Gammaproteobacteria bacterium]